MYLGRAFLFLLVSFVATNMSFAQEHLGGTLASAPAPAPAPVSLEDSSILELRAQVHLLKEQNQIISSFQDKILNTVYFALNGVFGAALLLASFGWWSNYRKVSNDLSAFRASMNSEMAEHNAHNLAEFAKLSKDIRQSTENTMNAFQVRLDGDMLSLRGELSGLREKVDSVQDETRKGFHKQDERINSLIKDIALADYDLRRAEEKIWELKELPINIIVTQSQGLDSAIEVEHKEFVSEVLGRMEETLKKYYENISEEMDEEAYDLLMENMGAAGKYDKVKAAAVRRLLKSALDKAPLS